MAVRTVVLGPPPPELAALIARRKELGLDGYDEVWDGEYHMAPPVHTSHGRLQVQVGRLLGPLADASGLVLMGPFNLGDPDDFRVPDLGLHREDPNRTWVPTAAIVVEIESPDDETWEKLPFYARRGVEEILVVANAGRSVMWLVLEDGEYVAAEASRLLGPASSQLGELIDWPAH